MIEIGPNLSGALAIFSVCFMFAAFFWAITRH